MRHAVRRFTWHLGEMFLAMALGVAALDAVFNGILALAGTSYAEAIDTAPAALALILMFNMTVPMLLWMRVRGHDVGEVSEMGVGMVVVGATTVFLLWLSIIDSGVICGLECGLMLPAMVAAGFKAWLELGYCVRKGEKAIRIIAPMPITERDRGSGEETGETLTLFEGVSVFDAQQVEPLPSGEPTPLRPPSQPLSGASHAHLIAPTIAFAQPLGYTVSYEPIAGSGDGWCNTRAKRIVVDTNGPANARLRTLIHEVIHALGVDYQHYARAQAEVIVDTTTLVVLGGLDLDVSGQTVPYVAG